jgi:sirohydrochlorin ferrochelatase
MAIPAIQAALEAADRSKKRLLLVIDEAQVLASPEHTGLAHALRAGLDIRKAAVKVLFAGSSEAALREMFSRAAAPFYNWAPVEPFPLLGREFVTAMVKQLAKVAKHPLKLDDALKAYASLKETPEFFRWYIERYVMYQSQGPEQALAYTKARVHDDTSYAKTWKELSRADRAVLFMASRGVQDLYGAATLQNLRQMLGSEEISANTTRAAIRRLTGAKLQLMARVDHGAYRFEDPEFQTWVAARRTID